MQPLVKTRLEESDDKPIMSFESGKPRGSREENNNRSRGSAEIIRDIIDYVGSRPPGEVKQSHILLFCNMGYSQFMVYKSKMISSGLVIWNIVDRSFIVTEEGRKFAQAVNKLEELLDGLPVKVESESKKEREE